MAVQIFVRWFNYEATIQVEYIKPTKVIFPVIHKFLFLRYV